MSGCGGGLAMPVPVREPGGSLPLAAAVQAWAARYPLGALAGPLGVSTLMLERIAAGEIVPEPSLAAGLWRELGREDAQAARCEAVAAAQAASACPAPPSFVLQPGSGRVGMSFAGRITWYGMDQARAMRRELADLIEIHDHPKKFGE